MIASRKHGFIFIKTMNTAGTSIELALGPHCGPDDVLTPINERFDLDRAREGVFPRNFGKSEVEGRYVSALRTRDMKTVKAALQDNQATGLASHADPRQIRDRLGEAFWQSAFKFTSERHPYEKVLSLAAMAKKKVDHIVYSDYRYVSHGAYLANGQMLVDRVIRYGTLEEEMAEVMARFGLPRAQLPHARRTERDRRPAREQLDADQRAFIYKQCAPEFELFGWER